MSLSGRPQDKALPGIFQLTQGAETARGRKTQGTFKTTAISQVAAELNEALATVGLKEKMYQGHRLSIEGLDHAAMRILDRQLLELRQGYIPPLEQPVTHRL
jgi:hypothetical protein